METADGRSLGGGVTLGESVRRAVLGLGFDLGAAVCAATAVPARALGVDHLVGSLAPARTADLCVLDVALRVVRVMLAGGWLE